ncbi:MAG TPA: PHP domain-containing protein, partial [Gaiellaceae bacterium]|nr:PHP domain-containing protein [Gaiellaceae bacterium]
IEARLRELVETGRIAELDELEAQALPELVGVAALLGVSAKRMRELGHALGIRTLPELREAAAQGQLDSVPGIGPKTAARIAQGLAELGTARPRRGMLLNRALALVGEVAAALGGEPAGDPRRACELSTRFAVVVPQDRLVEAEGLPQIVAVLERDERRVVGVTADGYPIEVVGATPESWERELIHAIGSPEWVAAHGELPREALPPPELREPDAPPPPPDLLELADVRGDLHVHSTASDGKATVEEMGRAAQALGYEYLAICDHTRNVRVVPGLDADDLRRQAEGIAAANDVLTPFRILRGSECDILPDGSLDLPDDVLAELEWVQISLHAGQRASRQAITDRVLEAMRHAATIKGAASCLSHPKGRILNHRPENALDLERVFETALETGVAVEVNGLPDRLDLSGSHVRDAIAAGVPIVCSTDAHSVRGLGNMALSVATARRGGAPRGAVLNTRSLADLLSG